MHDDQWRLSQPVRGERMDPTVRETRRGDSCHVYRVTTSLPVSLSVTHLIIPLRAAQRRLLGGGRHISDVHHACAEEGQHHREKA